MSGTTDDDWTLAWTKRGPEQHHLRTREGQGPHSGGSLLRAQLPTLHRHQSTSMQRHPLRDPWVLNFVKRSHTMVHPVSGLPAYLPTHQTLCRGQMVCASRPHIQGKQMNHFIARREKNGNPLWILPRAIGVSAYRLYRRYWLLPNGMLSIYFPNEMLSTMGKSI